MKNRILGLLVGLAAASAPAHAAVVHVFNNGTPHSTIALAGSLTTGDDMAGMEVTVTFSDSTTKQGVWGTTGANAGAASVANWFSLTQSGDTFNTFSWTLSNLNATASITSFSLYGAPGGTIFDTGLVGDTPGSGAGNVFTFQNGAINAVATYSDILNLGANPPAGDEYVRVTVDLAAGSYIGPGGSAVFMQDADNASSQGPIVAVPETSTTMLLAGLAMLGLFAAKRRMAA